jgi:hypothetical protein
MRTLLTALLIVLPTAAQADCTCLTSDGAVKEGQTACLKTADGPRLARCGKSQNVTSWFFSDERCEVKSSALSSTKRPHQSLRDSFSTGEATIVPSALKRGNAFNVPSPLEKVPQRGG